MRSLVRCAVLFALCFLLSSCLPDSDRPLCDPALAHIDARLTGVWFFVNEDNEPTYVHFAAKDSHWTQAVTVEYLKEGGLRSGNDGLYEFFIYDMDNSHYMNFINKPQGPKADAEAPSYFFGKYEISKEGVLSIWILNDENTVRSAIEAGALKGEVSGKKDWTQSVRITDTSENIASFVRKSDPKKLFGEKVLRLKKIHEPK